MVAAAVPSTNKLGNRLIIRFDSGCSGTLNSLLGSLELPTLSS